MFRKEQALVEKKNDGHSKKANMALFDKRRPNILLNKFYFKSKSRRNIDVYLTYHIMQIEILTT